MQRADHMMDELGPDWEEDTIYCEATCQPEEILYEGSDDDDYDSPSTRRLRYEAAGQRFLNGVEPFLLTAHLRGPFDKASGWVNPWRSKHRTVRATQLIGGSSEKPIQLRKRKRLVSVPETTQAETQNSLECHLPSPESLKQASVVDLHPYLEQDELAMVQNWRSSVEPTSLAKDSFWASTPRGDRSARKRRARSSGWLKKLATKRRRTEIMEMGSVNTPLARRSDMDIIQPRIPTGMSFSSIGPLPSSTLRSTPRRRSSEPKSNSQVPDDEDELMIAATSVSGSVDPSSSARRVSPRRDVQPNFDNKVHDCEDELSQEQLTAAATLSSPISQRQCSSRRSPLKEHSSQGTGGRQTPSRQKPSNPDIIAPDTKREASTTQKNESLTNQEDREDDDVFETQEDQSFCFKMRHKPLEEVTSSRAGVSNSRSLEPGPAEVEEETWAGFSSEDEEAHSSSSIASSKIHNKATPPVLRNVRVALHGSESAEDSENEDASSSVLSSILSQYFEGFDSTVLASQDATERSAENEEKVEEVIEVATAQKKQKSALWQNEPNSATPEILAEGMSTNPSAPEDGTKEGEGSDDPMELDQQIGDETMDASDDSFSEDENLEGLVPKSQPNPPSKKLKEVKVNIPSPSFSGGALLLKAAVRRSMPASSWSRISQLRNVSASSPLSKVATQKASPIQSSNDVSTASEEDSDEEDYDTDSESGSGPGSESVPETGSAGVNEDPPAKPLAQTVDSLINNDVVRNQVSTEAQAFHALPRQGTVKEGQEDDTRNIDSRMEVDKVGDQSLSTSQQSPWARSQLSQYAAMAMIHPSQEEATKDLAITPDKADKSSEAPAPEAQTPWRDGVKLSMNREAITPNLRNAAQLVLSQEPSGFIKTPVMDIPARKQIISATPDMAQGLSTPEPRFSVKSFASFMSPSPEQRPRRLPRASWRDSGSRLPSTQGILASAMKNPWSTKSDRRVSWASLPGEDEKFSPPIPAETLPPLSQPRSRASSPPPLFPIADLPTSDDAEFHEHFKVMIRRTQDRCQNILPTESQRTVGSPSPLGMAKKFVEVDEVLQHPDEAETNEEAESLPVLKPVEKPQDNVDFVEHVFREMSDYLETWDVDTELEQARKEGSAEAPRPQIDVSAQSPW